MAAGILVAKPWHVDPGQHPTRCHVTPFMTGSVCIELDETGRASVQTDPLVTPTSTPRAKGRDNVVVRAIGFPHPTKALSSWVAGICVTPTS